MKTVLVLSYWNLNRCASGGVRRIHGLLSALGDGVLLCQPGPPHPTYRTVPYTVDFGRHKIGINWGMFNFLWPANKRLVRRLIREHQPALVVLTSVWNQFALAGCGDIPLVLDAHDVNAVAVGERCGRMHPFTLMVKACERWTVRRMNHVFACSPIDRDQFIQLYGLPPERVSVVPNGVDVSGFDAFVPPVAVDPALEAKLHGATVLFFMGNYSYQPNRVALRFLSDVLLPDLEQRAPGRFRLLVCGGSAPAAACHPAMVFAGAVSDETLRRCIKRSAICLAPIMTGSGTRLKVLEYMAAGRPVVTTPKGAEGITCRDGQDIVIAEPRDFAEAVASLAADPDRMAQLGAAGHDRVEATYDWKRSIAPRWRDVVGQWLDEFKTSTREGSE